MGLDPENQIIFELQMKTGNMAEHGEWNQKEATLQ